MQIEISTKIIIDGNPTEFTYKIEDGKDQDLCELVKIASTKLCSKLQKVINEQCK